MAYSYHQRHNREAAHLTLYLRDLRKGTICILVDIACILLQSNGVDNLPDYELKLFEALSEYAFLLA